MRSSSQIILPQFFSKARAARKFFDSVFKDPRKSHPKRFVWDHWHLEGQYRLHRAMARDFLPKALYKQLCDKLVSYGQNELGCHSISEPWISYYTEGDFQDLHTDSPHGPWAYVYSLTDWDHRQFLGGETQVLKDEILNYWQNYTRKRGFENSDLFDLILPKFNQLLVFDPRRPHGVRRVSGTHEPRYGRLVIHGWFVHPEPFVIGAHDPQDVTDVLNIEIPKVFAATKITNWPTGVLTFQLTISRAGKVTSIKIKTNSLVGGGEDQSAFVTKTLLRKLKTFNFGKARGQTRLILPIVLD